MIQGEAKKDGDDLLAQDVEDLKEASAVPLPRVLAHGTHQLIKAPTKLGETGLVRRFREKRLRSLLSLEFAHRTDVLSVGGKKWRKMTPEQRQVYIDLVKPETDAYRRQVDEYRKSSLNWVHIRYLLTYFLSFFILSLHSYLFLCVCLHLLFQIEKTCGNIWLPGISLNMGLPTGIWMSVIFFLFDYVRISFILFLI